MLYDGSLDEEIVVYVGRTDDRPVRERLAEHARKFGIPLFKFQYCSKKREAYEIECWLWHTRQPINNAVHPQKPAGKKYPCPWPRCNK